MDNFEIFYNNTKLNEALEMLEFIIGEEKTNKVRNRLETGTYDEKSLYLYIFNCFIKNQENTYTHNNTCMSGLR